MIKEKLKNFDTKEYQNIIFFLKDYIYHSAHQNYLELPKIILDVLNINERKTLNDLIKQIKGSAEKETHLNEINSIINNTYLKEEKTLKKEAQNILIELSKSIPKEKGFVAEVSTGNVVESILVRGGVLRAGERIQRGNRGGGQKRGVSREINKLLQRRGKLQKKGFPSPFSIQSSHDNEVVIREVKLQNGVTIRVVVDEDKFEQYKYGNPIITGQALDLIVKDFNKGIK